MKVLSLWQPWATLVVTGKKKYECRSWKTAYRGPLLIHASAHKPNKKESSFFSQADFFKSYIQNMDQLPYGAIIGKVVLQEIYSTEWVVQNLETLDPHHNWPQELAFDDYGPQRFAWHLKKAEAFDFVLPVKGSLGLWDYQTSIL
jgi:hypothetical protein